MNVSSSNNLVFVWWNTSLAPSGRSRSTDLEKEVALNVILYLISKCNADFIALGEMSKEDMSHLEGPCEELGYNFLSGITKAGGSQFDVCYLFNAAKLAVLHERDVVSTKGTSTLKVAKRVDLLLMDGTIFNVFVSHWPSRLWCEENHADRHTFGIRLRDSVELVTNDLEVKPFIVLMGDYNDEPFSESISSQLMASRDFNLVQCRSHLLYNPFWHCLCRQGPESQASGSYFHKQGALTQWRTFDQIIFSNAFLTSKKWVYTHSSELVLEIPELIDLVKSHKSMFDHLPVRGIVEKVTAHV